MFIFIFSRFIPVPQDTTQTHTQHRLIKCAAVTPLIFLLLYFVSSAVCMAHTAPSILRCEVHHSLTRPAAAAGAATPDFAAEG